MQIRYRIMQIRAPIMQIRAPIMQIGLSDLRADVAEQVGDVVLDELVVHNRLPVRVEQPLELVDLLLLVRLGRQAGAATGYSAVRTQGALNARTSCFWQA